MKNVKDIFVWQMRILYYYYYASLVSCSTFSGILILNTIMTIVFYGFIFIYIYTQNDNNLSIYYAHVS